MIPPFDEDLGYLPPGIHWATWDELSECCGTNSRRRELLAGLRAAAENLRDAGCRTLYLDGSFASTRDIPGDYDGCWDPMGVDPDLLDPVLLDFRPGRIAQKIKFGGELFISSEIEGASGLVFEEFFQTDKEGNVKGIIAIDLRKL